MDDKNIQDSAESELEELEKMMKATVFVEMKASCKLMFELYKGYIEAGFDERQALQLLIETIKAVSPKGGA